MRAQLSIESRIDVWGIPKSSLNRSGAHGLGNPKSSPPPCGERECYKIYDFVLLRWALYGGQEANIGFGLTSSTPTARNCNFVTGARNRDLEIPL